jgi:hypothetical protein
MEVGRCRELQAVKLRKRHDSESWNNFLLPWDLNIGTVLLSRLFSVETVICCGVWKIKCRQGSKMNKSNCRFWRKLNNPSQNLYCGLWPIKSNQGSKTNKSNCQFWKKSTYDWLVDNPSQDLFGQIPQYELESTVGSGASCRIFELFWTIFEDFKD